MTPKWQQMIEEATSAALATNGPHGLNVVPLSVWRVEDGVVYLYDFFMTKTAENLRAKPAVALSLWQGFRGLQLKGEVVYDTSSAQYEAAAVEMKERFPDRTLHGLIRLTPTAIYDVAPGSSGENLL